MDMNNLNCRKGLMNHILMHHSLYDLVEVRCTTGQRETDTVALLLMTALMVITIIATPSSTDQITIVAVKREERVVADMDPIRTQPTTTITPLVTTDAKVTKAIEVTQIILPHRRFRVINSDQITVLCQTKISLSKAAVKGDTSSRANGKDALPTHALSPQQDMHTLPRVISRGTTRTIRVACLGNPHLDLPTMIGSDPTTVTMMVSAMKI